ncbi:MAG TPA: hypothetical protein VFZ44_09630 [Pyrinomonadaceae bacterium]
MDSSSHKRGVVSTAARLLAFRLTAEEFRGFGLAHLLFGLACTWVVGAGRWWDDPRAGALQQTGLGSVVYVFILAGLLWVVALPLRPRRWSYRHVLTFVALTAPPAALYAIPVEMLYGMETARALNVLFLFFVASWRVALLLFYLRRHAGLSASAAVVAAFLPVVAIVSTLTVLNLERAVFTTMGGLRGEQTVNDSAYVVLILLTYFSVLLLPLLLIAYAYLIVKARSRVEADESW